MKKIKKSLSLFSIWMGIILLISCEKESKNIFSEPQSERLEKQLLTVRNQLRDAPDGWKIVYSPDTAKLGAFTFIMRFVDDRTVEMLSDFDKESMTPKRSEYRLSLGSSVKLSFITENAIHKMSDSGNRPSITFGNKGYEGDFEFIYYGKKGEDLLFKGNRKYNEVRFRKATKQDWSDLRSDKSFMPYLWGKSFFGTKMELREGGSDTRSYQLTSVVKTRRYNWREITGEKKDVRSFRILSITPRGFVTSPVRVGGAELSDFVYDATNRNFVSEKNGQQLTLLTKITYDPGKTFGKDKDGGFNGFIYFTGNASDDSRSAPETSDAFKALVDDVRLKLYREAPLNPVLTQFRIQLNLRFTTVPNTVFYRISYYLDIPSTKKTIYPAHYFSYKIENDKITMKHESWNTAAKEYKDYLQPISDVFINEVGVYMKETPRFTRYSNRIFAFIKSSDESLVAGGFYAY